MNFCFFFVHEQCMAYLSPPDFWFKTPDDSMTGMVDLITLLVQNVGSLCLVANTSHDPVTLP
jgi:hypothetical protein